MLELKHIFKQFDKRMILEDINVCFPDCGFIGIQGESGCGKSSLLYILGMLDHDFQGEVYFQGELINDPEDYIRCHVSYMMQNKDFISSLTIQENIFLANQVSSYAIDQVQYKKIVNQLDIQNLLNRYPHQLSGGQLKRVSIAKALLKQSSILLCDEPTGALHQKQAHEVMALLKECAKTRLVVIVSHDPKLLKTYCDSVLTLKNGQLNGVMKQKTHQFVTLQKQFHSLFIYPLRQFLYQKNKLIFLLIFQWIIILATFLMMTTMNGVFDAIQEDEKHAVLANITTIEKKGNTPFETLIHIPQSYVTYHYQLEQLSTDFSASLSFLPQDTNHIQLQSGRLPKSANEVIISPLKNQKIGDKLTLAYQEQHFDMTIVGVLKTSLFASEEIYLSPLFQDNIPELKDNYVLNVESKNTKQAYQSLSQNYIAYHEVLERVESYQSLLDLAKMVFYVFLSVSFIISLILIRIVLSILYFERKHDVAYLLSLGMKKTRLVRLTLIESSLLGFFIALGGCALSQVFYYYLNYVFDFYQHFHIQLMKRPIFHSHRDLFVIIFVVYIVMSILATIQPLRTMMKTNMIDVLREE